MGGRRRGGRRERGKKGKGGRGEDVMRDLALSPKINFGVATMAYAAIGSHKALIRF